MAQVKYLDYAGLEVLVAQIKAGDAAALKAAKDYVGVIPAEATQTDVISYLMAEIAKAKAEATFDGKAASVTVEDANGYYNATTVEGALAEVKKIADDNASDLVTIKGSGDGSINKALQDAKDYADGQIGELKIGDTSYSTVKDYVDAKDTALTTAVTDAQTDATQALADAKSAQDDVDALEELVGTIPEGATATTVVGYAKEVADAASSSAGKVAKDLVDYIASNDAAVKKAQDQADKGVNDAKAAQDDVDALEGVVGDMSAVKTTAKTVAGAVDELYDALADAQEAGEVTLTTAETTTEGYLKTYVLSQGGEEIGKIDIPKDMVVKSGSVVKNPEGQPEGTYIKLIIANDEETPIYINVKNLVDIYKGAENATQVQISVNDYEISATIVAGSVGTTELADSAVTTAKIADKNVTKAKLAEGVQASLDAADAAAGLAETAEQNAKDYADDLDTAMDTRVSALEEAIGEGGAVADQIKDAIDLLDATVSTVSESTPDPVLNISVTETDGKLTAISASVKAETFDAYGAAAAVSGYAAGETAKTVKEVAAEIAGIESIPDEDIVKLFTGEEVTE